MKKLQTLDLILWERAPCVDPICDPCEMISGNGVCDITSSMATAFLNRIFPRSKALVSRNALFKEFYCGYFQQTFILVPHRLSMLACHPIRSYSYFYRNIFREYLETLFHNLQTGRIFQKLPKATYWLMCLCIWFKPCVLQASNDDFKEHVWITSL